MVTDLQLNLARPTWELLTESLKIGFYERSASDVEAEAEAGSGSGYFLWEAEAVNIK